MGYGVLKYFKVEGLYVFQRKHLCSTLFRLLFYLGNEFNKSYDLDLKTISVIAGH